MMLLMSIPISATPQERLQHLLEVHELVTYVLRVHKMTCKLFLSRRQHPSYNRETRFGLLQRASFYEVNSIENLRTNNWDLLMS
jgi:hypothetical protein